MKLLGLVFGCLGAVTASVLFEPRQPNSTDVWYAIIGNSIAVAFWEGFFLVWQKANDEQHRNDIIEYVFVFPVIFYLCGFGFVAYTARH